MLREDRDPPEESVYQEPQGQQESRGLRLVHQLVHFKVFRKNKVSVS